jgi:hypothetical protein
MHLYNFFKFVLYTTQFIFKQQKNWISSTTNLYLDLKM